MESRIKTLLRSENNKRLLSNIVSLGSLQIVSYVLPLITIPYLIRVIGLENFGLISFVLAFTMYFVLLSDYGFNLSATKQISDSRWDREEYSKIFCEVLIVKAILMIFSFVILSLLMVFDFFNNYSLVYFMTFGMVVGQVLFPVWFFQGMEEMKHIAIVNLVSKTVFTTLIFVFVNDQDDYWIVPLLTSLGFIFGGGYALIKAILKYNVIISCPKKNRVLSQIKGGWYIFLSRIYVSFYTTMNTIILGFMTSNIVVGYYVVAEKIIQALGGLFGPILQAFYPFLANIYRRSKDEFYSLFKRLNIFLLVSVILLASISWLFSDVIVALMVGELDTNVTVLFSILVFSLVTAPFGPSFTNGLLVLGEDAKVSKIVLNTMLVNMMLVIPLIYCFEAVGLAFAWVIGQVYHVLLYIYEYRKVIKGMNVKCVV
ncbi:MAG: flippase [Saccharospirillaceae bacterium]|nr:flippase [Saccharospirillaceae bacterium]MCD8531348.1 flippase [Saccharospirillaceae bacterium]